LPLGKLTPPTRQTKPFNGSATPTGGNLAPFDSPPSMGRSS
jgi:hypothetical protein